MRYPNRVAGYVFVVISMVALAGCASMAVTSTSPSRYRETGLASYYAHKFHGRATASGEIYDENRLTAAHPRLPFGTFVRVTNLSNRRNAIVRINDRGPISDTRIIDVSFRAAQELDFVQEGTVRVRVEIVEKDRL